MLTQEPFGATDAQQSPQGLGRRDRSNRHGVEERP
jgi:hypothetical protein